VAIHVATGRQGGQRRGLIAAPVAWNGASRHRVVRPVVGRLRVAGIRLA